MVARYTGKTNVSVSTERIDERTGRMALAGGIIGLTLVPLALVPNIGLLVFLPISLAAIILSAIGLRSRRRRGWAITGLVVGSLGLLVGLFFLLLIFSLMTNGVI